MGPKRHFTVVETHAETLNHRGIPARPPEGERRSPTDHQAVPCEGNGAGRPYPHEARGEGVRIVGGCVLGSKTDSTLGRA